MSGLHGPAAGRLDRRRGRTLVLGLVVAAALLGLPSIAAAAPPTPPTSTAAFTPAGIQPNGVSTLTITLSNANGGAQMLRLGERVVIPRPRTQGTPCATSAECPAGGS